MSRSYGTVGIEVEVPFIDFVESEDISWFLQDKYATYEDCGGLEFHSEPLTTQRDLHRWERTFRSDIRPAVEDNLLSWKSGDSDCGIHVHFRHPDWWQDTPQYVSPQTSVFKILHPMVNRAREEEFFWEFSGRQFSYSWKHNGRTDNWDQGMSRSSDILRRSSNTLEFRVWQFDPANILPALEFTHSINRFISLQKNMKLVRAECPREKAPYMADWADWLAGVKGYNILKNHPALKLIK